MPHELRPSSFPMYPDCSRRTVAKMLPGLLQEVGFQPRQLDARIATGSGIATHAAVAFMLTPKITTGELAPAKDSEDAGIAVLREQISYGVLYDGVSPDQNTTEKQVIRQTKAFRYHAAAGIKPIAIEERLAISTKNGNTVSGQVDCADDGVIDLKTGVVRRQNMAQYGMYSIIRRAHGHDVQRLREIYVPRVRIDKEQPPPETISLIRRQSERIAAGILDRMEADIAAFEESGNPEVFVANPNSFLCGDKWCPVWGTKFCTEHK